MWTTAFNYSIIYKHEITAFTKLIYENYYYQLKLLIYEYYYFL